MSNCFIDNFYLIKSPNMFSRQLFTLKKNNAWKSLTVANVSSA